MEALQNLTVKPQLQLRSSLPRGTHLHRFRHQHRRNYYPSKSRTVSSGFFKTLTTSPTFSIKASISDSQSSPSSSSHLLSFVKLPLCIAVATAAIFASRLSPFRPLPALAEAPVSESVLEEAGDDAVKEEKVDAVLEKDLQEKLTSNPNDIESLKSLLEVKMTVRKLQEVVEIATKLIEFEPEEVEWRLLRGHTYCYMGDYDSAKPEFEEIIAKDQNKVEAYHGLVMSATQLDVDDGKELSEVERRILQAIERLSKEGKTDEMRDFYLLIAQIRVIQGEYLSALNVYQALVKQEPRDYRPYLCQGIIYTLLRKKKEAEEQFEKYKRLVPKEHPYADYFDDNVKNTAKVFAEVGEK